MNAYLRPSSAAPTAFSRSRASRYLRKQPGGLFRVVEFSGAAAFLAEDVGFGAKGGKLWSARRESGVPPAAAGRRLHRRHCRGTIGAPPANAPARRERGLPLSAKVPDSWLDRPCRLSSLLCWEGRYQIVSIPEACILRSRVINGRPSARSRISPGMYAKSDPAARRRRG